MRRSDSSGRDFHRGKWRCSPVAPVVTLDTCDANRELHGYRERRTDSCVRKWNTLAVMDVSNAVRARLNLSRWSLEIRVLACLQTCSMGLWLGVQVGMLIRCVLAKAWGV